MSASDWKVGIFLAAGVKKEEFYVQSPATGNWENEAGFGGKRLFVRLFVLFFYGPTLVSGNDVKS